VSLFDGRPVAPELTHADVVAGLSQALATWVSMLDAAARLAFLSRRLSRLTRALDAADRRLVEHHRTLDGLEQGVVREARLLTATAAAVAVNRFLQAEAFDTVVIEEAAMVPLPMVFLCAARATAKVLIVGDPMQLPSIVQSTDPFVLRAMARTIFAVTAPNPFVSPLVSLLEEQYRMHPVIGGIVSRVFYGDRLRQAVAAADLAHVVHAAPYCGNPVVLLDTGGHTACESVDPGPSRCNEGNARAVVDLVRQALAADVRSIAVITPYTAQARLVRASLKALGADPQRVVCRTVHGFQGNERDLVILDTVDTDPFPPGVLVAGDRPGRAAANLVNVAISRARGKLILVADRGYYLRACPRAAIAKVVEACAAAGRVVTLR
jgi:superfamily I DNA and/or RNA helicase